MVWQKKCQTIFLDVFADVVSPIKKRKETGIVIEEKRVREIKSNFLNKYIYSLIIILILLLVAIFYFVSR